MTAAEARPRMAALAERDLGLTLLPMAQSKKHKKSSKHGDKEKKHHKRDDKDKGSKKDSKRDKHDRSEASSPKPAAEHDDTAAPPKVQVCTCLHTSSHFSASILHHAHCTALHRTGLLALCIDLSGECLWQLAVGNCAQSARSSCSALRLCGAPRRRIQSVSQQKRARCP